MRIDGLIGTGGVNYLASPYTHPDPLERAARARAAGYAAFLLTRCHHIVYSPIVHGHALTGYGTLQTDWAYWERHCRLMLRNCSRVLVLQLPGWEESVGIAEEVKIAEGWGIPVVYLDFPERRDLR